MLNIHKTQRIIVYLPYIWEIISQSCENIMFVVAAIFKMTQMYEDCRKLSSASEVKSVC